MRTLLLVSLLIVLASVAAPGLVTRYLERPTRLEATTSTEPREGPASPEAALRQTEIRAEEDGHFYVDALVNLRPVRMMVDTGATVVALRQSDAAAAGIRVRAPDFRYPVQTANGTTKAAEAMLDSINVTDIEVEGVRALVLPDDRLAVSLLGASFLGRLARYEVRGGTLIFEN